MGFGHHGLDVQVHLSPTVAGHFVFFDATAGCTTWGGAHPHETGFAIFQGFGDFLEYNGVHTATTDPTFQYASFIHDGFIPGFS